MEKGSGIGIAIGFAIAAVAFFWASGAFAQHQHPRVCETYSYCTDWRLNPFKRWQPAPRRGSYALHSGSVSSGKAGK